MSTTNNTRLERFSDSKDPCIIFDTLKNTFTSETDELKKALEEAITKSINKSKTP